MIPRERIDAATVPGGEELTLFRRGADFFITLGRNELMTSRMSGSEEALAELACSGLKPGARVLIGGYGMGFTLRRALAVLPEAAEVVVAEIVPAILIWARGPMAELTAGCLDDPRVTVIEGDVGTVIRDHPGTYDDPPRCRQWTRRPEPRRKRSAVPCRWIGCGAGGAKARRGAGRVVGSSGPGLCTSVQGCRLPG